MTARTALRHQKKQPASPVMGAGRLTLLNYSGFFWVKLTSGVVIRS